MVNNWAKTTPTNFRFTGAITYDKRLKDVDKELEQFFEAIGPLYGKTLVLLIQLPPSMQIHEGLQSLRELVLELDTRFRYAVYIKSASLNTSIMLNEHKSAFE